MQNLQNTLIELLKDDTNYTSEGKLLKNKLTEDALKLESSLLKYLLKNDRLKKHFFIDVDDTLVFDKDKFIQFVNDKEFLPDSYTSFRNKIGLLDEDGKYFSEKRDVVLAWPYKDCVLEGGQDKEDQKRNEIFYNEVLAPDEIDRLFDPKVFTNFKRYDKDSEKENPQDIKRSDNLIIKGNNLLALHSLNKLYREKVKLIYIDPPYNTGGAANTFKYNNNFNHSTWLSFMKNRLEICKSLLKEDGVICIAIDDEEYAHLKIICDDVFSRDCFIGTIIVQSNPRGRTINSHFATCHEYALFYAKNPMKVEVQNQPLSTEQEAQFDKVDSNGKYRLLPFRRSGGTSTPDERPNSEFPLFYSKKLKNIIAVGGRRTSKPSKPYETDEILTLNNSHEIVIIDPKNFMEKNDQEIIELLPVDVLGKRRVWRWSDRLEILKSASNGEFITVENNGNYTVQLKDRIKDGRKPKTIWSDSRYDASANGTMLLKNMFDGEKLFSYPKSLFTVKDTIQILTKPQDNDIVLDFFAGSGTTAHAVLELNKEDDGNRKYILCEQLDYIKSVTIRRIQKLNNEFGCKGFVYTEMKKWNQNYIDEIGDATTSKELLAIYKKMKNEDFFRYDVDLTDFEEIEFSKLELDQQKEVLIECLDKNHLYVNLSEMNDATYNITDEDKAMNIKFYGLD